MNNRFILLILLFSISFSCVGCIFFDIYREQQEIEKLPYLEYDSEGNVIYNGGIYRLEDVDFYFPYKFVGSKCQPIAQEKYWGVPSAIYACGEEDFGEHVYISVFSGSPGGREYLKSDFVFPDYMCEQISKIYIETGEHNTQKNDLTNYFQESNLTLGDIITPCSTDISSRKVDWVDWLDVYFTNYQTIYLADAYVFIYNDQVYIEIENVNGVSRNTYIVNDKYQELFKNAIAERLE